MLGVGSGVYVGVGIGVAVRAGSAVNISKGVGVSDGSIVRLDPCAAASGVMLT